jgi:1,4-alpha-glucan branching enzyme
MAKLKQKKVNVKAEVKKEPLKKAKKTAAKIQNKQKPGESKKTKAMKPAGTKPIGKAGQKVVSADLSNVLPHSLFSDQDIELFKSGKHYRLYEKMGAHVLKRNGDAGTYFAVWAPNAFQVRVIGDFNGWDKRSHTLFARWDGSGIWEGFVPGIKQGDTYKYFIEDYKGDTFEKADPYAFYAELRPQTASRVWDLEHSHNDKGWKAKRLRINALNKPYSVYEIHPGSWKRDPHMPERFLTYRELAAELPAYCSDMGFTHVELMPVMEHPYDGSWGYQQTGYFAATSRYGTPQDLMFLIDELHRYDIGVLLDWVPSHFPGDAHGLYLFDGSHVYEHADMRKGYQPDWKSYVFNTGRNEVKSFLISNAMFWMDKYQIDGLRVDAVASMLYLDYGRKEGEWIPNAHGGNDNPDNVAFFKELNEAVYGAFPGVQVIAEESTSWPGISKPVHDGGLGFGMKWMMGWMNDTLKYFKREPVFRKWHQNDLTFSIMYAFKENFMLPFSHDEVVHGKSPMIFKMPGDEWQRYANLRLLYTYMWTHPGTKLLFMGNEFAQTSEWNFEGGLDWHLLQYEPHKGIQNLVRSLNRLYRAEPAMYEHTFSPDGFQWIAADDTENSVLVYLRKGRKPKDTLLVVLNMTPEVLYDYRIGVPKKGIYTEIFNSDDLLFWGSGVLNASVRSEAIEKHNHKQSVSVTVPPLGAMVLKGGGRYLVPGT